MSTGKTMAVCTFAVAVLFSSHLFAEDYPTKPIEVIVGFAAGGSIDTGARIIGNAMQEYLGQPLVAIQKPGAGGAIASEYVAKAKADGYTVLCSSVGPDVIVPAMNLNIPYGIDDFISLGAHGTLSLIISVKPSSEFRTINQLVKYGKENPGKLTYGTGGVGAPTMVFVELLKKAAMFRAEHIAFKGGVPSVTAAAGGHVDFASADIIATLPLLESKKVRAILVSGSKRDPQLPEVPTVIEAGYPEANFEVWQGFQIAKGTPQPIVKKLSEAFKRAVNKPSVQDSLRKVGFIPGYIGGEEIQRRMKVEFKTFRELAKDVGFLIK